MRRVLITVLALCLLSVTADAEARARTLPARFSRQIQVVNAAPHAPAVLLPRSMPLDASHLYASGGPSDHGYALSLGAVKNCGGADACFVAYFAAERAHTVFGTRVHVKGASKAGFHPLSCGASCAPPQIDFVVGAVRYTIQANLKRTKHGDKAALIAAAQDAIAAGPR